MPDLICRTIASGEVKRPTPTTGLEVSALMPRTRSSCAPSGLKREVPEHCFPRAMRQIPQIGQIAVHLDEIAHFGVGKAQRSGLVQRQAQGDRHFALGLLARVLDHLAQKPRAVFQAAAVFIGALIGGAAQEMLKDAKAMRAVKADQVKPRLLAAAKGVAEPAAQVRDIARGPSCGPAPDRR